MRLPVSRIVIATMLAVLMLPAVAHAADLAALKAQKATLDRQLESAGSSFRKALYRLEANEDRTAELEKRSKATRIQLQREQAALQTRARSLYRLGGVDYVDAVLQSSDFVDLFTRMDYVRSVVEEDATQVRDIKALRIRLASEEKALRSAHGSLQADARSMRSKRRALSALLKQKQKEYEAAKAGLGAAAALARTGYAPKGPNGLVFPVDGPCYYDDTWGASRSGGRRRHQGTDIMAAMGTPCVAACDGDISSKEGGLGGKVIYLDGDNGWRFYYAHLSGWAVRSGHVKAGQLIGYVGATGNAAGGAPHLHLQMWSPGGSIVNPYSYLREMQG